MNVLITGGCGFLGANLAASFLDEGASVTIIDALFRNSSVFNLRWLHERCQSKGLKFIQADLADIESVLAAFRLHGPFDFIAHVGGQVAMTTSLQDPRRDMMTNIVGTFNVLEATRALSPKAFLAYSSTNKVYGDLEWLSYTENESRYTLLDYPNGLPESLPLDFSTPYGCSKGSADQYVRDWYRVYGVGTVVFRHSSIYGGRQFASFDQGWIGWFCKLGIEQQVEYQQGQSLTPFTIAGSGKQVRDVLHANDLVTLYKAAYERRDQIAGEVFNIGGGSNNALSLLELLELLAELLDIPPMKYNKSLRRASDQDVFIADIRKVHRLLGWTPQVNYRQGIMSMLEWINTQKLQP